MGAPPHTFFYHGGDSSSIVGAYNDESHVQQLIRFGSCATFVHAFHKLTEISMAIRKVGY